MELSEEQIHKLDALLPELARSAGAEAFARARAAGLPVTISEDDKMIELLPDGSKRFIKDLLPGVPVIRGQKLRIK